ncbi:MAG: NAD-dependent protein deacylase [Erysipelotrichaceae bacterium]|nr:NAD-dependent protein deacylase [Erysipelotrichaceae bacterium]
MNRIDTLIKYINEANKIVYFTGAGVSTASGIPDFRSQNGLYNKELGYSVSSEEILSTSFFKTNPKEFFDFSFKYLFKKDLKPAIAHKFPVFLKSKNKDVIVITQNIDGLHQEAGIDKVIELHGTQNTATCSKCNKKYDGKKILELLDDEGIPRCTYDNGIVRHDVILFGQNLNQKDINDSIKEISEADLLIVAGTSLNVYPAAGLVHYFRGKHIVVVNKEAINISEDVLFIEEDMNDVFAKIMQK